MIITRTPTRISLGGGGTDIRSYASRHGGSLVSAAINKYVHIAVSERFEGDIRLSYAKTEIAERVEQLEHPIVRATLQFLAMGPGIEIVSIADVPANTGLGTSGSFTVGLLNALHTFKQENVPSKILAEEASTILMDILDEPIGKHDQYLAAFGGLTYLDIDRTGETAVCPSPTYNGSLQELESCVLLFYTGIRRMASDILKDQSQSVSGGDSDVTEALHTVKRIGVEVRSALEKGDIHRFGELLDQHWQSKRQLSAKVAPDCVNRWYEIGKASGAVGGKLVGAGGGGFLMFCCGYNDQACLREAMEREGLREMHFAVEPQGSKVMMNA